jgi:3-oxoacyl-[acyl-carrier protein] reductase
MTPTNLPGRIQGKTALVTGVGYLRGIGMMVARRLAQEGARVMATDILESVHARAAELQAEGLPVLACQADLTRREQVEALVAETLKQLGRIDILVNVAGKSVPPRPPFLEMTDDYWNLVLDRNLKTTYLCCKVVLPEMVKQRYGKVVNISSFTGVKYAYRYSAAYAASKGAVSGLTKALALEFGEYGINVNAVLPGDIWVNDREWTPADGRRDLGVHDPFLAPPITRPGRPEEIADGVLFLCSEESRFIAGAELLIDGGASIVEPATAPPAK